MFRFLFRRPRTIRVPVESANVDLHRVNIVQNSDQFRARPALTQFVLSGFFVFLSIQAIRHFDPFDQHKDSKPDSNKTIAKREGPSQYGAHWDEQHAQKVSGSIDLTQPKSENSDLLRLTLPIWLRKGPMRAYPAYDPAVKEYQKLQADKKRVADLKKLIIDSIFKTMKNSGMHNIELSLINFNGKVQGGLDIVPQLVAPPLYQVPCIWLSSDSLPEYGWRYLPPDTGARVERIFRPQALFEAASLASQVFVYTVYAITKAKINKTFGISNSQASSEHTHITMPQISPTPSPSDSPSDASLGTMKSPTPTFPFLPNISDGRTTKQIHQDVVSSMPYSLAITQAAATFNLAKSMKQSAAASQNVRGACEIRGVVKFLGELGTFWMEVQVWYLPSENMFLGHVQVKQSYVILDYNAVAQLNQEKGKAAREQYQQRKLEQKRQEEESSSGKEEKSSSGGDTNNSPSDEESEE